MRTPNEPSEPEEDDVAYPQLTCPMCLADCGSDLDGFGVVHCLNCGYCAHLSRTGGVCEVCGDDDGSERR